MWTPRLRKIIQAVLTADASQEREGVSKSWGDHYNCFWQESSSNMYMRENESSLSCQPLNWDIYDGGVEGRDGFLLSAMGKKWQFLSPRRAGRSMHGGLERDLILPLFNSKRRCALEQSILLHTAQVELHRIAAQLSTEWNISFVAPVYQCKSVATML